MHSKLAKYISIILAIVMIASLMPGYQPAAKAETEGFAGKTVSILSHSASTYAGVSNNTADNSTIGNNDVYYTAGRHGVYLKDTWWQQAIDALGMRLLVNNSWSGSCVFQPRKGEASVTYKDRAVNLHNDHTGEEPDIIWVYIGGNDFAYYKDTFGKAADVDYSALIKDNGDGTFTYAAPANTCEAYAITLHKAQNRYPDAQIYCMTSTARRETDYTGDSYPDAGQPTEYSAQLQAIAEHFGYPVIDLEKAIPKDTEIFDKYMGDKRAHPNALGMDQITNELLSVMLGRDAEICHVTSEQGVVAEQAVLKGGSYSAEVELQDGYSVTVAMAGKDITAEAWQNGRIAIEEVTGDITVTSHRPPMQFAWEVSGSELISAGENENLPKKLEGTITDGVFNNGRYELASPVILRNDLPWIVEWKCAGDWRAAMLSSASGTTKEGTVYLTRTKGGQLCFGTRAGSQYDNYGVDLSELDAQSHTYRLENRIADDGGNMVWLYLDGAELGPMNNYFIGSNGQNKTFDWVSGKDFVFSYIGTDSNKLSNCELEYLRVKECDHTYENGICTGCGVVHPNLASFEGKVISVLSASTSTFAGYIPVADGFNLAHRARYPQDNLLTDVDETWWMQLVNALDAKLGINDSWAGSQVLNTQDTNSGDLGPDAAMASLTRIKNLGANGTPDVILFFGAGNDIGRGVALGSFDPASAPTTVDLTSTKWDSLADAYVAAIMRLQHFYPDSEIVAMTTYAMPGYATEAKLNRYGAVIEAICEHYGVPYLNLRDSGVTFDMLPDDIHPNAEGMDHITEAVLNKLLNDVELGSGENTVYSVTHELSNAKASLGYYKGISAGKPFAETLSGDDLTVTVTMGGKDITASCYADGKVNIPAVTGDVKITAKAKFNADGHLQQLPEKVCAGTNLWTALEPENIYYTVNGWGLFSNAPNVHSVTFPVEAGERIWATSFGKTSSGIGTRITWFTENGLLETVAREKVYDEFTANGYITVPDGAASVNIPMGDASPDREIYLLDRAHTYTNGVCEACGKKEPAAALANYKGKVISVMGDSISTYAGYIPVADGFNLTHRTRYPDTSRIPDVIDVNQTWWMQLINELDAKLGINESWAGSCIYWGDNMTTKNSDTGEKAAMASLTRIQNLGSNGTPDLIFLYGGGNDRAKGVTVGSFNPANVPAEADLTAVKWDTFADSCVAAIMRMQHYYPDAEIVVLMSRAGDENDYIRVMREICEYFEVAFLFLNEYGLTSDMHPDGSHPNAEGMDVITDAILAVLADESTMTPRENTVYSVTHELSSAKASLGYYKGISAGKAFAETLSGDDLTVTVTMGGKDITASCYADGKVNIPAVTGDVKITAKARFNADGHLQQLPETVCAGTNLWTALEPENIYYTVNGWGNTTAGTSWSITFPVKAGDRIWATSLGAYPGNGSAANGVRITWFDENGVLKTVAREQVYAEFARDGYVTAPEGATALNLPMTGNKPDYAAYILNLEHTYTATVTPPTCTEQGYTTYTCACGDSYVDSYVNPTGIAYEVEDIVTARKCMDVAATSGICGKERCTENHIMQAFDVCDGIVFVTYDGGSVICYDLETGEKLSHFLLGSSISHEHHCGNAMFGTAKYAESDRFPLLYSSGDLSTKACYVERILTDANGVPIGSELVQWIDFDLGKYAGANGAQAVVDPANGRILYQQRKASSIAVTDNAFVIGEFPLPEVGEGILGENGYRIVSYSVDDLLTPVYVLPYYAPYYQGADYCNGLLLQSHGAARTSLGTVTGIMVFDGENPPHSFLRYVDLSQVIGHYEPQGVSVSNGRLFVSAFAQTPAVYELEVDVGIDPNQKLLLSCAEETELVKQITAQVETLLKKQAKGYELQAVKLGEEGSADVVVKTPYTKQNLTLSYHITDHPYTAVITAPTCTEQGYTTYTCACGDSYVADYVDATGHDYENGICTGCGEQNDYSGHLQQLPEQFCGGTNLWPLLRHDADYYYAGTHWGQLDDVHSVTIPVMPGDQLAATSFSRGIRVTYFDGDGMMTSVADTQVKQEFEQNGYLTVPDGAAAVNIPMWDNSDANELYIRNRPHSYADDSCSLCGYERLRVGAEVMKQMVGGVYVEDGTYNAAFTNNWFADIPIPRGAEQVRVLTFKTAAGCGSVFFGAGKHLSGYADTKVGGQWVTLNIPAGADTFRYCYVYDSVAQEVGLPLFEYVEFYGRELGEVEPPPFAYRPATGCHSFSVEVNIAPAQGDPNGYEKGTDYGYIQLPANYDPYGEPTRLIIVCHGAGANLSTYQSDAWKTTNYSFWTDLGYAVMDMYASPTELAGDTGGLHYGSPIVVDCYKAGYDYVMDRFNLKQDGIFLIGSSMGGLSSFQIAQSGKFPVIAQVGYCPAIDTFKQAYVNPWSTASYQRSRIAKYFGFTGTAPTFTNTKFPSAAEIEYYKNNFDKTIPYSPIFSKVVSGDLEKIFDVIPSSATAVSAEEEALYQQLTATHPNPLMIFHNTDDGTVAYRYSKYFVDMVNRSGQNAILRTFTSGGHNAWANGANYTVPGLNGNITIKESQYEAYLFFKKYEEHETHIGWVDPAAAPACTETGLTQGSHCAVCGEVLLEQEVVAATGHTPGEAVKENEAADGAYDSVVYCTACGTELSREHVEGKTHTPGDINGDGSVNNKDFTRLFQYLADWDVEVVEAALDVNGDGTVNNKDLTRLFQYLSDWDVVIH